jgi:hypothetical protein
MTEIFKENMVSIIEASHSELSAKQRHSESPINLIKTTKLPISGYYVDLQIKSAYDFINNSIKELSKNTDKKYNQASLLSTVVGTIYIPDPDDPEEYYEIDSPMDITKTIYSLGDTDNIVLNKQNELLLKDLSFEYGLMNIECPHCHQKTLSLPVDIETILFYKYQQALSTKIE